MAVNEGRDQLDIFAEEADARAEATRAADPVPPGHVTDVLDGPLPDSRARARIAHDLDTNLLVEAGAGAGKTKMMVERLVALVRTGKARIDEVAAVTFTRKAAAELRERFQIELESALRAARIAISDGDVDDAAAAAQVERLDAALRGIDRAFLGTIHSFCARLLRERPLDAGLDPAFREVFGADELRLRRAFWERWLEAGVAAGDPALERLAAVGLRPAAVYRLFGTLSENPDVELPTGACAKPVVGTLREELGDLMDRAESLIPAMEPERGWDRLQERVRELRFHRWVVGWNSDVAFFDALAGLLSRSLSITQNRWAANAAGKEAAKALLADFQAYADPNGDARRALDAWWAYRYPIAVDVARAAAEAYARERIRSGRLTFQDLLTLAATLLRERPAARALLGERYRRVLVDEFQDTDPVQAEVLLLLASTHGDDWRRVVPRPGALFVVGDPKQSIYRFRRADIGTYAQVRSRFNEWGDVVSLTANFRSHPPIQALVDAVFAPRPDSPHAFPAEATRHQAAYAPLDVQHGDAPGQGLFWYELSPECASAEDIARDDAERLASWILARVEAGERAPGDFLVLTTRKNPLAHYGRALEARGLPVQISGSAVGIEQELDELLRLLRTLADPADAVGVVATLVGPFFGLDHEQLAAHVMDGDHRRGFDFRRTTGVPEKPVERALAELHELWRIATSLPADAALAAIVDRLGLLPYAAAGELGDSRAGALVYVLDAARAASLDGETSLPAALDAIEAALENEDAEAPLQPGREDVVRLMNLHKVKGLEAPVVVLAHPRKTWPRTPGQHIERSDDGPARAYFTLVERQGRGEETLARPLDWPAHEAEEALCDAAERDRLLYVAVTRAREELVVARAPKTEATSAWAPLHEPLDRLGTRLELEHVPSPPADQLDRDADAIEAEVGDVAAARSNAARPGYAATVITRLAAQSTEEAGPEQAAAMDAQVGEADAVAAAMDPRDRPDIDPLTWGTIVHRALEAAGRGRTAPEDVCRNILIEADAPTNASGEPSDIDALVALVGAVTRSALWTRARQASHRLVEVPFADARTDGGLEVREGVIDLAFREDGGWVVVDYKTGTSGADPARRALHRRQVELYAESWAKLTGETVGERAIFYVRNGEVDRWLAATGEWSLEQLTEQGESRAT